MSEAAGPALVVTKHCDCERIVCFGTKEHILGEAQVETAHKLDIEPSTLQ